LPFPAWQLFDLGKYRMSPYKKDKQSKGNSEFAVQLSRGCPFKCAFCSHAGGLKLRTKSVANVIKEIEYLISRHNANQITFFADTLTVDRNYIIELCKLLIENNLNEKISWCGYTRTDRLDTDLLMLMKRSGCNSLGIGIESGSQKILDAVNKNMVLEKASQVAADIKKVGIVSHASFIIGFPMDTKRTIKETITFACKLPVDYATFAMFVPYPGTALTSKYQENIKTFDWDLYDTQTGYLLNNPNLSSKEIERFHRLAYFRFYFRWGYFFKIFKIVNLHTLFSFCVNKALSFIVRK